MNNVKLPPPPPPPKQGLKDQSHFKYLRERAVFVPQVHPAYFIIIIFRTNIKYEGTISILADLFKSGLRRVIK
jgi:hypothetical protein